MKSNNVSQNNGNNNVKVYTKEDIQALLGKNDLAVVRGVEAIYARQTADERSSQTTSYNNGMGFNGTDAYILSSFAGQIADWRAEKVETGSNRYPFPLSPKQLVLARRKMFKYAGQLAAVANAKVEAMYAEAAAEAASERAAIQTAEDDEYNEFDGVVVEPYPAELQGVDPSHTPEYEDEYLSLA